MELLLLREALVLVAVMAAAYTDYRTGLIYDKITYPLIAIGVALNLYEVIVGGLSLWNLAVFFGLGAAVFLLGYLFYFTGKVGGGDVKLFTGMAFVLPVLDRQVFLLNVLLIGVVIAVVVLAVYFLAKYARKGISLEENRKGIKKALPLGLLMYAYIALMVSNGFFSMNALYVLIVPITLALVFVALEPGIRKNFFLKKVKLSELEEDEIIASEHLDKGILSSLNLGLKGVIGKKEKKVLQGMGVKEVPVYRDLPRMGVFILAGVLFSIAFENPIGALFL